MIVVPTEHSVILGASARLLDENASLKAWAEEYVRQDPDLRWILGNYVEADEPNSNGHIFPLSELTAAQHTLAGKPLNMLHREHYIVGYFAGAHLKRAQTGELAAMNQSPMAAGAQAAHLEALAGMWHNRFPEEYFNIRRAHAEGTLYFSMEALPESVSCPTCQATAVFAGFSSDTYCEHMQGMTAPKVLHKPVFCGGAIIIPPVKPGWHKADITAISKLITERPDEAAATYEALERDMPHLAAREWELMMAQVIEAREFSTKMREQMAEEGMAMPDGSFPIKSRQDVRNAIRAVGRAPAGKRAAVRQHIKKRARALNCEELIPEGW